MSINFMTSQSRQARSRSHYQARLPVLDRRKGERGWRIVAPDGTSGVRLSDNKQMELCRHSQAECFTVPDGAIRAIHFYETCEAAPTLRCMVEVVVK